MKDKICLYYYTIDESASFLLRYMKRSKEETSVLLLYVQVDSLCLGLQPVLEGPSGESWETFLCRCYKGIKQCMLVSRDIYTVHLSF